MYILNGKPRHFTVIDLRLPCKNEMDFSIHAVTILRIKRPNAIKLMNNWELINLIDNHIIDIHGLDGERNSTHFRL